MELEQIRHSLSHVMAQAVTELYPGVKVAIGPAIDTGFYYDFEFPTGVTLSTDDLPKIEEKMKEILKSKQTFVREELSIEEAKKMFVDQKYKVELIEDLAKNGETQVSIYKNEANGELKFVDLCRGPHVSSTEELPSDAFKLNKVAGAYWRGDENREMLTRIYALAFADKAALEQHLNFLVEAEKRDHRKLGKELELFHIDEMVGKGLVLWLPKGALLWRVMEEYWYKKHLRSGYELVRTPHIGNRKLWETSGHWGFYNDSMYPTMEVGQSLGAAQKGEKAKVKEEYLIKPMNCPFHVVMYGSKLRSYRELPIRWAEMGTVYRYEQSGELSGLTRVRGFTQDDAHIICTKEQVKEELLRVAKFIIEMLTDFGFKDYKISLSVRDPENTVKYAGNDEGWAHTEKVLEEVATELNLDYSKEVGEAAFYGPKLDFKLKDAIGRTWQCSTLQFDFNLPERFDLTFINDKGETERPYMLHRALLGSFERFIGVMIENFAGALPFWVAPEQVRLISVADKHIDKVKELQAELATIDVRAKADSSSETIGNKIRKAAGDKVPYTVVIGDKEIENLNELNIKVFGSKDNVLLSWDDFKGKLVAKNQNKDIDYSI
ncbi:MAG TPA: threonine--tRNA ligase [bacterium]|mgnify:CR=1 FL=1|nr:threonine--tRNA ligase [bacterium]